MHGAWCMCSVQGWRPYRLGMLLHAGREPVGLRAAACVVCSSLTVYCARTLLQGVTLLRHVT